MDNKASENRLKRNNIQMMVFFSKKLFYILVFFILTCDARSFGQHFLRVNNNVLSIATQ
jgi:hypothetical protein